MLSNKFFRSEFLKNVLVLLTGTGLGQFITLLASPILSRIYSPAEYGVFTLFVSTASMMAAISAARYDLAIMLPKSTNHAINVLMLAVYICISFSLSLLTVAGLVGLLVYFKVITLSLLMSQWIWFFPFLVFLLGIQQIFNYWLIRNKQYREVAITRITNSASNNGLAILFGLLKFREWGIFLSNFIGQIIYFFNLFYFVRKLSKADLQYVSSKKIKAKAEEYKEFPRTSISQAIVDMFQINGIVYFLPIFFSIVEVGYYSRALIVLQAPISLLGNAFSQVFYQNASEVHHAKGDLRPLITSTIKKSVFVILPICILLMLFGPLLFSFVFGNQWEESGHYSRILALWLLFDFIRICVSSIPLILNKQRRFFLISILGPIILLLSMWMGYLMNDVHLALLLFAVGQSCLILYLLTWIYKIASPQKNA